MRDLMLDRIAELKQREAGFSKGTMRWKHTKFNDVHVQDIRYATLSDKDLLDVYDMIRYRAMMQM